MKLERTINSIFYLLNFHQFNVDIDAFSKKIRSHPDYPSILSYNDIFSDFNVKCHIIKVAENNIDALPFPLLAILSDENENSILTFVNKVGTHFQYLKDNSLLNLEKQELENIWLGVVIVIGNLDNILVEANDVENHLTNSNISPDSSNNCRLVGMRNEIINKSDFYNLNIEVIGNENFIRIDEGTVLPSCSIKIRGNKNVIVISGNCRISGEYLLEGFQNTIKIGSETTIEHATLSATESKSIEIGKDCMLSNNISIQTSDSHSIISSINHKRINGPGNVVLKDHVWIAPRVNILKGITIESGSVVGIGSIVTKDIPQNCVFAGNPAKMIKSNVIWKRELIRNP
jgi:acetyltransferase-like isoleucine patch superfamily enzyme